MDQDWAFIGTEKDTVLIAEGPFQKVSACPIGQTAVYKNNFDLSDPTPWHIPHRLYEATREELAAQFSTRPIHSDWVTPDADSFAQVFESIQAEIQAGRLKKSVPVVTERVQAPAGTLSQFISAIAQMPAGVHPYGFFTKEGEGLLGASPEFLFSSFEGKVKTMALAGTARAEDQAIFTVDQKEIQEHEFVAQTLLDTLTPLGMTRRHARQVVNLGPIVHFQTLIDVELYRSMKPDEIIRALHPTPALGPLPRNLDNLAQLGMCRDALGCPEEFGAPFGIYHAGRLELLVAIRNLFYSSGELIIPSGCGVISESRLTNEWRELKIKRESVKRLFGLL